MPAAPVKRVQGGGSLGRGAGGGAAGSAWKLNRSLLGSLGMDFSAEKEAREVEALVLAAAAADTLPFVACVVSLPFVLTFSSSLFVSRIGTSTTSSMTMSGVTGGGDLKVDGRPFPLRVGLDFLAALFDPSSSGSSTSY